jgi:hypothetical protein
MSCKYKYKGLSYSREDLITELFKDSKAIEQLNSSLGINLENISKVVDSNGQPLVVWHLTNEKFTTFNKKNIGSNFNLDKEGFFFSSDKRLLEEIILPDSQVKIPVFIDIKSPVNEENFNIGIEEDNQDDFPLKGIWGFDMNREAIIEFKNKKNKDGVILKGWDRDLEQIVAFNPNQIKSATENIGTFSTQNPDIRFSIVEDSAQQNNSQLNFTEKETLQQTLTQLQLSGLADNVYFLTPNEIENKLVELGYNRDIAYSIAQSTQNPYYDIIEGFYSPIEKAVTELPQERGTANQFLAQIKKSKGVKQEELLYTGVEQYLTEQGNNKITKQDILDYMRENRIEIREVVKGVEDTNNWFGENDNYEKDYGEVKLEITNDGDGEGGWIVWDGERRVDYNIFNLQSAKDVADTYAENQYGAKQTEQKDTTKFSQYQLEGDKSSYKEILITLPNYEYIDSHWSEKGILVWVRMNTRIDDNGNKVLFLEEMQSGAGQKGKKEGFDDINRSKLVKKQEQITKDIWERFKLKNPDDVTYLTRNEIVSAKDPNGRFMIEDYTKNDSVLNNLWEEFQQNKNRIGNIKRITPAPFVTSTPSWIRLAMKTAIKEAVRQGATSIAWTTGEQQSDRYSLAEQVNSILVTPNDTGRFVFIDMKSNYDVTLNVDKNGKIVEDKNNLQGQQSFAGKDLEDIVGKDMAQKILLETKENKYQGEGLKVGGQGMRAFYDNIVPKETKKLIKELTGKEGVVGETEIKGAGKAEIEGVEIFGTEGRGEYNKYRTATTQQSIEITPELKKAVSEGLPMFSQTHKNGKITTNGFTDFNDIYINTAAQNPLQTALHEYGHIYLNKLKQQRPDLYAKGIELAKSEEAQDIINFVKRNQPKLQVGSQKFNEEVLAEVIGRSSEMLIMDKKSELTNWLSEVWDWIKQQLGLLDMTTEQVANLTLQEYASAIGVDVLSGRELFSNDSIYDKALQARDFEDFVSMASDFRDAHTAPSKDIESTEYRKEQAGNFNLKEVAQGIHNVPEDYFEPNIGARYYAYRDNQGMQSYTAINNIIRGLKAGKQDLKIIAYRAIPIDLDLNTLLDFDWVTFSKDYAINHGESRFGENAYKIIEQDVSIEDVWWDGNDIREWGYDTGNTKSYSRRELKEIWDKTRGVAFQQLQETTPQLQETDNSIPFNSLSEDALLERMIEDGQIERLCRL